MASPHGLWPFNKGFGALCPCAGTLGPGVLHRDTPLTRGAAWWAEVGLCPPAAQQEGSEAGGFCASSAPGHALHRPSCPLLPNRRAMSHPAAPPPPQAELTVICFTSSSASSCEESPAAGETPAHSPWWSPQLPLPATPGSREKQGWEFSF